MKILNREQFVLAKALEFALANLTELNDAVGTDFADDKLMVYDGKLIPQISEEEINNLSCTLEKVLAPQLADDKLDITVSDLYYLFAHYLKSPEQAQGEIREHGCRVNGVETKDPHYVVGSIVLTDFQVGKRQYIR